MNKSRQRDDTTSKYYKDIVFINYFIKSLPLYILFFSHELIPFHMKKHLLLAQFFVETAFISPSLFL